MRPTAYFIFVLAFVTFFKNSYPHYEERTAKRNRDKEDEFDPLNYDWNEWDNDGENTDEEFEEKDDSDQDCCKKKRQHGKFDRDKGNKRPRHHGRRRFFEGNKFEDERPSDRFDDYFEYLWENLEREFEEFRDKHEEPTVDYEDIYD